MKQIIIFLSVLFFLGCGESTIELTIEQDPNSKVSLSLKQTALSKLPVLGEYVQVLSGDNHSLALKSDGTLWAWGDNQYGQLGIGTITRSKSPVQIEGNTWRSISPAGDHSLALKSDGTLWAWGSNLLGQLGDGSTSNSLSPKQIGSDKDWESVTGAWQHTVALKSDGTIWAWGYDGYGPFGIGTDHVVYSTPISISSDTDWKSISTGGSSTTAIKIDGTLWVAGRNHAGQLGLGYATEMVTNLTEMTSNNNWASVSTDSYHTIGIKNDGSLWAWGGNDHGQLGIGSADTGAHYTPVKIGSDITWESTRTGLIYTLALKSDGTLWAWGNNGQGQLGDGTTISRSTPTQISGTTWASVSAGNDHTLALKSDGTLWSWGYNLYGQVGDGTSTNQVRPTLLDSDERLSMVSAGSYHALALKSDGTLWRWGQNDAGQLGDGTYNGSSTPIQLGSDTDWTAVSSGANHSLAIKSGTLWAWGDNYLKTLYGGQLGDGTTIDKISPIQIGTDNNWTSVSASQLHSHAIKSDGSLWGWGTSTDGQLGNGSSGQKLVPTQVGTDTDWSSVSSTKGHTVGLKTTGDIYVWGDDYYKTIDGLGDQYTPLLKGSGFKAVCAGYIHSIALKSDGTLWAWGANEAGVLGDGTTTTRTSLVEVLGDHNISSIACGSRHNAAIQTDGTLWVWGNGMTSPVQESTKATDWVSVSAGAGFTIGIKADGSSWSWGSNSFGQLGIDSGVNSLTSPASMGLRKQVNISDESYDWYSLSLNGNNELYSKGSNRYGQLGLGHTVPKDIFEKHPILATWSQISLGKEHAAGVQEDGTLWAWGDNQHKQLGFSSQLTYESFTTQIGAASNWQKVVCGDKFTVALKIDGTLWAWGDNSQGQLALGILSLDPLTPTPTQVGTFTHWTDIVAYKDALYVQKSDGTIWGSGNLIYFGLLEQ